MSANASQHEPTQVRQELTRVKQESETSQLDQETVVVLVGKVW